MRDFSFRPQQDRVLTEREMLDEIYMAVILHAAKFPHLKGAGAIKVSHHREAGLNIFARALKDQFLLSDVRLIIGPGAGGHSTG